MNETIFLDFFVEFKKVPIQTLKQYLQVAILRVPSVIWGARTNYATSLLMAHMLTLQGFGGEGAAGGAVNSEQVGDLSRGFSQVGESASGDAEYRTTRYGIMFIELRNEFIVGVMPAGPRFPVGLC